LPCTEDDACPEGQTCDLITRLCDGGAVDPAERVWIDDTAEHFAAGLQVSEVAIEPGGFVGPIGSFTGAVKTTGYAGMLAGNPTFEEIAANPPVGSGFARSWLINYGIDAPVGVGLPVTAVDNVTVTVEGEIELDVAGDWQFQLFADDAGFIDIAPPGGTFTRLINDTADSTRVPFRIDAPGWYRFRGAFRDNGGGMVFNFQIDSPVINGGVRPVTIDQMRVRADDLAGVAIDGFDDPQNIIYFGSSRADVLDKVYDTDPFSIPIGFGAMTVRSSGQLLIDTEGDYQFTIDSVHGHRMWIDNQKIADQMITEAATTTTEVIHLVPGWHDLVVDVQKSGTDEIAQLALSIAAGPTTGPIPSDHLRPVVARSQRFASGQSSNPAAIVDGGSGSRGITVVFPGEFVTEEIQWAIQVDHPQLPQVGITLNPPVGADIVVAATGSLAGAGVQYIGNTAPVADAGDSWVFTATDVAPADLVAGEIVKCGVTHFGRGGLAPFATSYRFESAVHDLGAVPDELREMGWRIRQGEPSAAAMQLRTCDDPAACTSEPWTDVAFGAVPQVPLRQFAQYGVTIATDGDVPTALDLVELRYLVR
jgi:hypothetical protein